MGRIKQIADATHAELQSFLDHLGWSENPFARPPTMDEFVIPSTNDIADVGSAINGDHGPVVIHSAFTGAGKTTMARALLADFEADYQPMFIGEHNTTAYELISILADGSGVGKSYSTKMTEEKIRQADFDRPLLAAVDEFGLNDPSTIHTLQFINDELDVRLILTGMTSQYEALRGVGPEGRAFARRVAVAIELGELDFRKTRELIERRIATAVGGAHEHAGASNDDETLHAPFTAEAVAEIHDRAQGVPGVVMAACADLIGLAAYTYANDGDGRVTRGLVDAHDFADPRADMEDLDE